MNEKDAMSRYLRPLAKGKIPFILFALLFVLSALGAVFAANQPKPEAVRMAKDGADDSYRYIDVQLMTTWVFKVTGEHNYAYYEVLDTDGNPFVVSVDDKQYEQYEAIVQYTTKMLDSGSAAEAIAPPPLRLYGVATTFPADDAEKMAGFYQGTVDEYYGAFGTTYLDAKRSPVSDLYSLCVIVAGVTCLLSFGTGLNLLVYGMVRRRSRRRLEKMGELEKAELEFLREDNLIFEKQGVVLSENFMYCKDWGAVVNYRDIVWMCNNVQRVFYFIPIGSALMVATPDGLSFIAANRQVTDEFLNQVAEVVAAKNSDVLLGRSAENQKEFGARVKAAKKAARADKKGDFS